MDNNNNNNNDKPQNNPKPATAPTKKQIIPKPGSSKKKPINKPPPKTQIVFDTDIAQSDNNNNNNNNNTGQKKVVAAPGATSNKTRERVKFIDPITKTVYTRAPEDDVDTANLHKERSAEEKRDIARRKINKFHHDPILDFDYKPHDHTEEEINQFYDVVNMQFTNRKKYEVKRIKEVPVLDEYLEEDGAVKPFNPEVQKLLSMKSLAEVPKALQEDHFHFLNGKLRLLMKSHLYIREAIIHVRPKYLQSAVIGATYTGADIIAFALKGGLYYTGVKKVQEEDMMDNTGIPADEYEKNKHTTKKQQQQQSHRRSGMMIITFRFVEVDKNQDEEDKATAIERGDADFVNLDYETITSVIEDRIRLNVLVVPISKDFDLDRFLDKYKHLRNVANAKQVFEDISEIEFIMGPIFFTA